MNILKIRYVAYLGSSGKIPGILACCKDHSIYHEVEDLHVAGHVAIRYTIYLMSDLEPISILMNANVYNCSLFTIDSRGKISKPADYMQLHIRSRIDFTVLQYTTQSFQEAFPYSNLT